MKFVPFDQQNIVLAENQEEYQSLPVNVNPEDPMQPMTFCLQLSTDELLAASDNDGKLYFTQCTFGKPFQPVGLSMDLPDSISPLTREEVGKILADREQAKRENEEALKRLPVTLKNWVFPQNNGAARLLPTMADGTLIPQIVKDSVSLRVCPSMTNQMGMAKLKLEIFVNIKDITDEDLKNFPGNIEHVSDKDF